MVTSTGTVEGVVASVVVVVGGVVGGGVGVVILIVVGGMVVGGRGGRGVGVGEKTEDRVASVSSTTGKEEGESRGLNTRQKEHHIKL